MKSLDESIAQSLPRDEGPYLSGTKSEDAFVYPHSCTASVSTETRNDQDGLPQQLHLTELGERIGIRKPQRLS